MSRSSLLVVGGGIGGLATAVAVARTGRPVCVLEQAAEFTERGAGLQLGANATRVLDRLGMLEEIDEVAVRPCRLRMMHAVTGDLLTTLDVGESYRARYGYPYLVLHRDDLLSTLLRHCRADGLITLKSGASVVEVVSRSDSVEVRCADGTTYRGGVAAGADGLRSTVRRHFSTTEPVDTGYRTYRGVLPVEQVPEHLLSGDVVVWIGPELHLVQYSIRRGELFNQAAVFKPALSPSPEELERRFAVACSPVRQSVSLLDSSRHWPVMDRTPLASWVDGRVALLGDAAHPMRQYLAQGACQALEDAVALADVLSMAGGQVPEALLSYQRVRLPRASRCQAAAALWGESWHTVDPVTIGLRDRLLRSRRLDDYSEVDWLYSDPSRVSAEV